MVDKGLEKIKDLSEIAGISRNTLSAVLQGKHQPSADVMYKLAKALGMSPLNIGEIFFNNCTYDM